jgi:hypothetical protein
VNPEKNDAHPGRRLSIVVLIGPDNLRGTGSNLVQYRREISSALQDQISASANKFALVAKAA